KEYVLMSTAVPPTFVTSTNSDAAGGESVGLYIHSVMTTWPGVVAPAGALDANVKTLAAASVRTIARARTRRVRMSGVSRQTRCTTPRVKVNERGTTAVRCSRGAPRHRSSRGGARRSRHLRRAVPRG